MNFLELLRVAFLALKTNKTRAALTMLGIIIGVAAVILLVSIGSGLQELITQQFEEMGSDLIMVMPGKMQFEDEAGREGGPPGIGNNKLTLAITNRLKRKSGLIERVVPIVTKSLTAKYAGETEDTAVLGTSEEYPEVRNAPIEEGRFFTKTDVAGAKRVAVLGQTVKENLFSDIDPVGKKITLSDQRYQIIGVLEEKGSIFSQDQDDLVVVPITTAQRHFDLEKISYIYLQAPSAEEIEEAIIEVEGILGNEIDEEDFSVVSPEELLSTVSSILGALTAGLGGIAAISLLVGGIGIMNIMLVSVTERTREIGLRKAVGATPQAILIQFLVEAIILSFVGGLLGILLGTLGSLALSNFIETSVTLWSVGLAFTVSALVGIVFGVAPAIKASKLNPIEALRYE